jgi:hypothetical protein
LEQVATQPVIEQLVPWKPFTSTPNGRRLLRQRTGDRATAFPAKNWRRAIRQLCRRSAWTFYGRGPPAPLIRKRRLKRPSPKNE